MEKKNLDQLQQLYCAQFMIGQSKPLYQYERKLAYQRHLDRLQQIQKERSKKVIQSDSLTKMHRIRNKSMQFHTQQHINNLNLQNQKIINTILQISKDKRKVFSTVEPPASIQYFYNPARKRKQREIDHNNLCLAERILRKHSQFDPNTQRRNIQLYEEVKKRMENNKKASLPQLQKVQRVNSMQRQRRKSVATQSLE